MTALQVVADALMPGGYADAGTYAAAGEVLDDLARDGYVILAPAHVERLKKWREEPPLLDPMAQVGWECAIEGVLSLVGNIKAER